MSHTEYFIKPATYHHAAKDGFTHHAAIKKGAKFVFMIEDDEEGGFYEKTVIVSKVKKFDGFTQFLFEGLPSPMYDQPFELGRNSHVKTF